MTNTFETTLTNIKDQESIFRKRDERAVEIVAVLPLLREVGWNTTRLSEIYPQHGLPGGGVVDYDLQIDGESRILIEVKRWEHDLDDKYETQLKEYCQFAKPRPKLAVLTNGRVWRLYLAPTATKGKNSVLRKFDEVDITAAEPMEVESTFRQFLARDSMVGFKRTLTAAQDLHYKLRNQQEQRRLLTEALSELANDENMQVELISEFAEKKGISINREIITRFLDSLHGPLVNEVTTKVNSTKKPASFRLPASPTGTRKKTYTVGSPRGWNKFLLEVCELMQKQHPENFHQKILSMPDWFAESEYSKFLNPVGDTGVYARKENAAGKIKDACYEIVTEFGYPRDSLEIMDSQGHTIL